LAVICAKEFELQEDSILAPRLIVRVMWSIVLVTSGGVDPTQNTDHTIHTVPHCRYSHNFNDDVYLGQSIKYVAVAGYIFRGGAKYIYIQLFQGAKKPKISISAVV